MSSISIYADGELTDESFVSKDITWKIYNVFGKFQDPVLESPPFTFASGTWCLRMYPNGQTEYASDGHIDLMIARVHSAVLNHRISFGICFKTRRGKEYESFSDVRDFNQFDQEFGAVKYLKSCQLRAKKDSIAANDIVTVFCRMRSEVEYSETDAAANVEKAQNESSVPQVTHGDRVLQDLRELLLSGESSDVTIKVRGQKFTAHRAILRARSTVFASMFKTDMKEKATGIVDVQDCEPSTFPDFLHFLYCGNVEKLSADNVYSLYTTADKYDVQDLKSSCRDFMKTNLSVDTFCETITFAMKHGENELKALCTYFFAKNLQSIIVTATWQTFLAENPTHSNELLIKALVPNKQTK